MPTRYGELQVLDAHVHFFSHQFFQAFLQRRGHQFPDQDPWHLLQRLGWEIPPQDPVALGRRWIEELDRHGVERAVLLGSIMDDEASVARAVQAFPDRLIGFIRVDPTRSDAAQRVRHAVERLGLKGIKRLHRHLQRQRLAALHALPHGSEAGVSAHPRSRGTRAPDFWH
jgi:predicted TIM-barrel fold metal-dependent hydrolase